MSKKLHKLVNGVEVPLTKEEIQEFKDRAIKHEQKMLLAYRDERAAHYPSVAEFLDAFYWYHNGQPEKMDEYFVKCQEVKAKFPKPSEVPNVEPTA